MNKYVISLAAFSAAVNLYAAPPTNPTNYIAGTVYTLDSFTDAGDTGLATGTVYVCFPASQLTTTEYTLAMVTNDVRPLLSSVVNAVYAGINAQASSNQFTSYTIKYNTQYEGGTNRYVYYNLREYQNVTVTPSYPAE